MTAILREKDASKDDLVTESNRAFFALTAKEYDRKGKGMAIEAAKGNAQAILERVRGLNTESSLVLDFATGTGLLAMLLAPHCHSLTAVDLSPEMIDVLKSKLEDPANRISNILPVQADLLQSGSQSKLPHQAYDLITCTNSFHHFADPSKVTKVLASFLKPGGKMAIADLFKTPESEKFHHHLKTADKEDDSHSVGGSEKHEDQEGRHKHHHHSHSHQGHQHEQGQHHGHKHVIAWKGGFTEEQMRGFFTGAGLKMLDMRKSSEFRREGGTYDVFLAIAQRAE